MMADDLACLVGRAQDDNEGSDEGSVMLCDSIVAVVDYSLFNASVCQSQA